VRTAPVISSIALVAAALVPALPSNASGGARASRVAASTALFTPAEATAGSSDVRHYEYVFDDGIVSIYDMDQGHALVKTISLPQTTVGIRGITAAPATHMLFISYGGDGGGNGNGSVLAYDLIGEKVVWTVHLGTGIDSGAVSPDGRRLYMPTGENTSSGIWNILDTASGTVIGTIQGGAGAHNTIVSNDGRYVYLGGRNHDFLDVYDTTTGAVREVGPLAGGVRPFTVNGSNTLAFTTATEFDGFQVSSIATGKVLFTVSFGPVPGGFAYSAPSHGVSLSPDEKQLYVIDSVNKEVRVYDVSRVSQGVAPVELGIIPVAGLNGTESPCAYDCAQDGWLQHSLDGRFVYVGDSGEVIDTATRAAVTTLTTLANTRKSLEIDWSGGVPIATSGRVGVGYITATAGPPVTPAGPVSGAPATGVLAIIRGLTISPRAFKATRGPARRRGAQTGGATVRYSDSEPALTRFTVLAPRIGVEKPGRGCVAVAPSGRRTSARRCTRFVTLGGFLHRDRRGRNSFAMTGLLGGRKLAPGSYRLKATPTFSARNGPARTVAFRVLR
jgi:WD40 repeat protein